MAALGLGLKKAFDARTSRGWEEQQREAEQRAEAEARRDEAEDEAARLTWRIRHLQDRLSQAQARDLVSRLDRDMALYQEGLLDKSTLESTVAEAVAVLRESAPGALPVPYPSEVIDLTGELPQGSRDEFLEDFDPGPSSPRQGRWPGSS